MSKQFLAVVAAIIIVFVGIFVISNNNSSSSNNSGGASPTSHIEGQGQDHVTLVEYGDYQCPYCAEYYPTVKQVASEYNTQMTFQFRNFPLTSLHPNAFAAARAAEAANLQGKFWQMHDLLYTQSVEYYNSNETLSNWVASSDPSTYFDQYAQELGLNVPKFKSDYSSDKVNNTVNADMNAGNALGVNATPTFYLDGKEIQVGNSVASFEKLINAAIAQKTGKSSSGGSSTTSAGTTQQTHAGSKTTSK